MDINLETVLLVLLIILPVAYFLWRNRRLEPQVQQSLDERREEYVQKITAQYGEPEQSLWTAEMPLLIYDGFMVMEGVRVPYDSIENVTWNNSSDYPTGGGIYQVIVRTHLPGHEFLYAQMGEDSEEARSMSEHLFSLMQQ